MNTPAIAPPPIHFSATELRALPPHQRDAILARAAELAESEYRTDPNLTAFEAFGNGDLYGISASSGPG